MPITYRSNPPSRDIKPMLEVMKKPVISEEVKACRAFSIVRPKSRDKAVRDYRLMKRAEAESKPVKTAVKPSKPEPIKVERKPYKNRSDYVDQITKMIEEGMSYRQIAAVLGLTASQISGMMFRMRRAK